MLWMLLATDLALGGTWFEGVLDYWGGKPYGPPATVAAEAPLEAEGAERDRVEPPSNEVDWDVLLDPTSEAFWREGDHVPPPAMMALIRDPTPENVARYRAWELKKMEATGRIAQLLVDAEKPPPVDWRGVQVVYFYASSCGYCKKNAPVVRELLELGADVMPVHLDRPSPDYPTSTPWSPEMAQLVDVIGTPTWVLVVDGERKVVRGYADRERLERRFKASAPR